MSGRDKGKKLFADLADKVRAEVQPSGEPAMHARGLQGLEEIADDLSSPDGLPGLKVFRDGVTKIRLQRPNRNGEIAIGWNRAIGAMTAVVNKGERSEPEVKYVYRPESDEWHRLDGTGELYADVGKWLVDVLYPEGKRNA